MSLAPIAQRLSSPSFPPQENSKSNGGPGAGSTFRYLVAGDARVLTHYIAVFFCTSPPFFCQKTQGRVFFLNLFSKAYVKLHSLRSNNRTYNETKHPEPATLLEFAYKWCWLFAASNTLQIGADANLIRLG